LSAAKTRRLDKLTPLIAAAKLHSGLNGSQLLREVRCVEEALVQVEHTLAAVT